ncbi:hypothetical protein D3C80_1987400 [compost metagenome]
MHHSSLDSQKRYTAPGIAEVSTALTAAGDRLDELTISGKIISPFNDWGEVLPETLEAFDSLEIRYRAKSLD